MPLQSFMAIGSNMKEIYSYRVLTVPAASRSCATADWHACSCCFIAPVTISFNHNVFHILAHTSTKFHGQSSCDAKDIDVALLTAPAVPIVMLPILQLRFPANQCSN